MLERKNNSPETYEKRERATIVTRAPMRITLAGGGTDVLWYSKDFGGAWISAGIDKYVYVFLNKTEDPNFIKASHGYEAYMGYNYQEIKVPIILNCLEVAQITRGVEVMTAADASAKSGLGGSGSLEVALLLALHAYKREPLSQEQLAKEACNVEIERLQRPIGPQDQYIAVLGGINYFEIDKKGVIYIEPLHGQLTTNTLAELEQNLLYFRTGIQRDASFVLEDEKEKAGQNNDESAKVIESLNAIKELGQQAKKFLLAGDVDSFGATFDRHWQIKKTLSPRVSNPQIDIWYKEAMKAGALGGKIMGAGGGGWLVFYVNQNKRKFRERMTELDLEEKRVHFDWEGAKVLINIS